MEYLGVYNNTACYRIKEVDFWNLINKNRDEEDKIYIIQETGKMICNREIFGYYDGHSVEEYEENVPYNICNYKDDKKEYKEEYAATNLEKELGVSINFSEYTSVVDEFFRNMK